MQISRILFALIVLLVMLIPNISSASTLNTTSNSTSSNSLNLASVATSNSLQAISSNSLKYINQSVIGKTFHDVMQPVSGYITDIVLLIFIIVLAYGLLEIYGEMNIEPEKKLRAMLEYVVGASSILLIAGVLYAYVGYFPQIIASTAPNLINIHSVIPVALIWFDLFVAVIISIFGFILAIKELLTFIRTFQPTLQSEAREFERNSALTRFLLLLAFAFFSPLIVGVLFVLITQIFFSVSLGISQALSSVPVNVTQYNIVSATVYSSNLPSCGANIFSGNFWTCLGASLIYFIFSHAYTVGFEAAILNTTIHLMLSPFGSNIIFDVIYEIILLILYVYGFIKIDWYSLQYISSLKTGEKEAFNYEKLKRAYIQYIGFIISPMLFVLALIMLNAFIAMLVSAMSSSNMYLIPPLLNINGAATVDNLLIDIAGFIMIIFAVILILFVIVFVLLRLIGGILFAIGIFFYLSEDYKYRAFGRNLLIGFIGLYLIPLILLLIFSFWFGFMSSAVSSALGSKGLMPVQATVGSYTATPIPNSSAINIQPGNVKVVCNNGTSIYNALSNSSLNNSDAHGVLLAGCENFVGYWGNGYIIMAFVSLALLIVGLLGFGTIAGAIGGITGLGGGEGAVSVFKGLHGKPLLQKMSKIASNMKQNRSRYLKSLERKGGIGHVVGGAMFTRTKSFFESGIKVASGAENVAYGLATAPIAGTALGNVLDATRQATKNVIASVTAKPEEYSYGKSDDVINAYAEKTRKPGESAKDAKIRAKKELEEKYGFEFDDKTKTFKVGSKNLKDFEDQTGLHVKASVSTFKELDGYDEAKKEYNKAEREYEKVEKAYKSGKASKSRLTKAKQKRDEAKKKLEEIATKGGYKNAEAYEDMKKLNDAYTDYQDALASGDNKKREQAKEKFKNVTREYEKKYGAKLNGGKLVQMMETSEGRMDVRNIMATAMSLQDPEMSARFISGAINGDKLILARERLAFTGSNIAKAVKTEFVNPAKSEARERFYSVKDILGKMKNYHLISGIGLVNAYNEEIKDVDKQFDSLMKDYDSKLAILNDPNSDPKDKADAKEAIKSLETNLQVLLREKQQLERSRKYVETPELLILSALNKKAIDDLKLAEAKEGRIISTRDAIHKLLESGAIKSPLQTLDNLGKLASGDELARINLTKAMLDNELRIKKKAIIETEKELNKIKEAQKDENLTESQKLQYKKMEEDLTYKYSMLNSEVKRITVDSSEISALANSLKVLKKPTIASTEYTVEKELGNYINSEIVENSDFVKENKKKKILIEEKEKLGILSNVASNITKENITSRNFELVDSAINDENIQLINDAFKDDVDAQIIKKINDIKVAINNGKNAINALDFLGSNEAKKLLDAKKASLIESLSAYRSSVEATKNPELLKKYDEFINSVANKINIDKLKNTSLENLKKEIQTEFEKTGLDKTINPAQINSVIMNQLGDKAVTEEIYKTYSDVLENMSEKIKAHVQTRGEIVDKTISEISEKEEPLLKKDIANIVYAPKTKNIYMSYQKMNRDREIAEKVIKEIVAQKAKSYNLQKSTIAVLSSFDNSIDEITDEKEKEQAIDFIYKEIIPELEKMKKYNLYAKVIYNRASNYEYDPSGFNAQEVARLTDLETQIEATQIATNREEFMKLFTKSKKPTVGGMEAKHHFHGIKTMRLGSNEAENEGNESETSRNDLGNREGENDVENRGEHWGMFDRNRAQNDNNANANNDEDTTQ